MRRTLFAITFVSFFCLQAAAQSFEFIENKGQWNENVKFKGELNAGAFFLKGNGYRVLQYDTAAFHHMLEAFSGHAKMPSGADASLRNPNPKAVVQNPSEEKITVNAHAYDVSFYGGAQNPVVLTERPMPGYSNYFIDNDKSKWASNVHSYGALVYKNVYPGIDVRYYSENGFIKYDLIVQPKAPVSSIALQYKGVEGLEVKNGDLFVKTSVGTIREQYPYSYQLVNGTRQEVKCKYELSGETVRFKLSNYDPSKVLVIDPTLVFCSFTGSLSDNWGYTATYDLAGNLYAGGIVFGSNYPVTPGAFQTSWAGGGNTGEQGGFDIGITKFNPKGTQRVYATYLGGSGGNEQPHSLVVDSRNNLVLAGRTTSSNYPIIGSAIGSGGGWDIIVTKLNAAGNALVGSVRIGGSGDDGVNIKHKYAAGAGPSSLQRNYGDDARSEVIIDGAGNICVASCTQSTNFPVTAGAFQSANAGGANRQDAMILKFNSALSNLVFASYLGGSEDDAAYVISNGGNSGDLYVAGGTCSANFPGDKSGTVGPAFAGGLCDGFIARISPDGSTLIKSTFIGTSAIDQVYGIQFDNMGAVYVEGTSTGNFPVRNAAFSQPGGKQFIAKLTPDMSSYVYSTVWGTNSPFPNISPIAFLVDRCENVYISGWGGTVIETATPFAVAGTNGLTVTPDALKSVTDGRDFYFFVMEKDATRLLFASFFGQQDPSRISDHVDGGTSRFDQDGIIYQAMCANCQGGQFPVTPGVIGASNPSGRCNEAVIKISFNLSGVRGGVRSSINNVPGDTSGCVPLTVVFSDTVLLAKSYEWTFGDGTPMVATNGSTIGHTFNAVGNYRVMMVAIDSSKCYPRDTTFVTIRVRSDKAPVAAAAVKLPPCESNAYRFDNISTAPAGKPFQNNSFLWIFGDGTPNVTAGTESVTHAFPAAGTYNVKLVLVDTNYCNTPDTFPVQLRVSPNVAARFETPASGCAPYTAQFENTSLGGSQFFWNFGDGTTSTELSPTKLYLEPGQYIVQLIAIDNSTCNLVDTTIFTITVSGKPRADFDFSPNPPEENIITTFTNLSSPASFYEWKFGDGATLTTVRRDTVVKHQYGRTDAYNTCLAAINQYGCRDSICKSVSILINPLLDVVSAFTPNGDGVNDRAVVIGYGIDKMTFKIYNRWGEMVYESGDPSQGWDGKYKGKAQPMDAYGYTLDAILVSGQRVKKSGSITLIR